MTIPGGISGLFDLMTINCKIWGEYEEIFTIICAYANLSKI